MRPNLRNVGGPASAEGSLATVTLNAAGPVTLNCLRQSGGGTVTALQRSLTAIPVSSIIQK